MDIRGLVLVNTARATGDARAAFAPESLALLEVAGMSALERVVERLRLHGITQITVVGSKPSPRAFRAPSGIEWRNALPGYLWRVSENAFNDLAQSGSDLVLLIRLGAYAEIDFEKLVQFHLEQHCHVSRAVHGRQALEVFCVSASRRNDAASLFRSQFGRCRSDCEPFVHSGYINPLADPGDLRQFAIDILSLNTETQPAGDEIKPGIWVAPGAWIEKGSRILAPAYIGSSARIRAGAVITRCTAIERHARVDCGTVVENSSVLPCACVGAGLDLAHSVVGIGQIANLRRSATVEVADPSLLGQVSGSAGLRLLSGAFELPGRIWRSLLARTPAQSPDLQETLRPSPASPDAVCDPKEAGEFASNLAVATRRYGNQ